MERIKRFLLEDSGSSEAASSVIMIAAVGGLLAVGLGTYYLAVNGFFGRVGTTVDTLQFTAPGGTVAS